MKNNQGFTLIELIVVIAIIGIIAAVAVPAFVNVTEEAHNANIDAVHGVLSSAIIMAASDSLASNGVWATPTNAQITAANMTTELSDDWTVAAPVWTYDPTGGTITYAQVGTDDYTLTVAY